MAIVRDRLNANKPATLELKPGTSTAAQLNDNKDLEPPRFFGSFFSSATAQQQNTKGSQATEAVFRLVLAFSRDIN
jgi:hypothetical protein